MSFLGNIFKSDKLKEPVDLSLIGTDMHSHLVPGIDDGSKTIEESIELIKSLYDFGYKKIITTPHIFTDYYNNTTEIIIKGFDNLKLAISEAQIPIQLEVAAEYMFDDSFIKKYRSGELLTFGEKYILLELPAFTPPNELLQTIFNLKIDGYNPILAHPERYSYWHYNMEHYASLKDRGVFFQINLPSLSGYYSSQVQKIAEQLIDNNMIEFVGTDLHNNIYLNEVDKSRFSKHLEKLVISGKLLNKTL